MFERGWEGEVEIRVPGKDSLRAKARLWRHEVVTGTDWGGQLEIDVATATRLGTGQYTMVLPGGGEATVQISKGASRARSAYPTFTGSGEPPFGDLLAPSFDDKLDSLADADGEPEVEQAEPAPPVIAGVTAESESAVDGEPVDASEDDTPNEDRLPVAKTSEPLVAQAIRTQRFTSAQQGQETTVTESPRSVGARAAARTTEVAAESATRTEVLARAYLQALQTRREIDGAGGDGFEALVVRGVAGIVDELTGLFEQSLRGGQPDGQRDGDWLQQRFIVLDWFRDVVTGYAPLTALSANLEELAGTAAALFEEGEQLAA